MTSTTSGAFTGSARRASRSTASACRGRAGRVYEAAARDPIARRFLVWARYPAIDVEAAPGGGTLVRFTDVRYRAADRLSGPVVELPPSGDRLD